jgi:small basic protein
MDFSDLLLHGLAFGAPAFFVAGLLAVFSGVLGARRADTKRIVANFGVNALVGLGVLASGLVFFGRDGKMASYAALVLALGLTQWWRSRAIRR